jgi:hypothetical protein
MTHDESTDQIELNKSAENGTNGHAVPPTENEGKTIVLNFGDAFEVTIHEGTIKNPETGTLYRISQTDPTADAKTAIIKGLGKIVFPNANSTFTPETLAAKTTENGQPTSREMQRQARSERIRQRIRNRQTEREESVRINGDPVERLANMFAHLPPERPVEDNETKDGQTPALYKSYSEYTQATMMEQEAEQPEFIKVQNRLIEQLASILNSPHRKKLLEQMVLRVKGDSIEQLANMFVYLQAEEAVKNYDEQENRGTDK